MFTVDDMRAAFDAGYEAGADDGWLEGHYGILGLPVESFDDWITGASGESSVYG